MKLNIGCGTNVFPLPWINVDRVDVEQTYLKHIRGLSGGNLSSWPEEQRELARNLDTGRIVFATWDMRAGFPMTKDGSVEAIYLGQVVEHLNPIHELPKLFKECLRMLQPGGVVRMTTPCLKKLLEAYSTGGLGDFASEQPAFYAKASPDMQLSYLMFGACGPDCTTERYEGHFHCWTADDLSHLLVDCGFRRAGEHTVPAPIFTDCIDKGMSHSFAVEAVK